MRVRPIHVALAAAAGLVVPYRRMDVSVRERETPQWAQDEKIAAAAEKRMRRRLRPQGSAS